MSSPVGCSPAVSDVLGEYTTLFLVCQEVFENIFYFFRGTF